MIQENNIHTQKAENCSYLFTVKELASILKTNIDYIHKLRKAGLLPFLKLGQYKVSKNELEKFIKKYKGFDVTNNPMVGASVACAVAVEKAG